MTSNEILANLKDNQGRLSRSGGYTLLDENYDKGLLRQIASSKISDLCSQELLVYPQSFNRGNPNDTILDYIEGNETKVYTGNMMGFVGRGDTNVFIHSRFANGDEDYFLHYMLMRIGGVNVFQFETSAGQTKDDFGNLLFYLFPSMLQRAMSQGILKSYVNRAYNDANLKGKIDLPRHIRKNKPTTGRICYQVREYSSDNVVMQLIRHCIEFMQKTKEGRSLLNCNSDIKKLVRLVCDFTPSFNSNDTQKIIAKNLKTPVHPFYADYKPLQHLCIAILRHQKLRYGGDDSKIYGVLFDGAWLWEEYVGVVIRDIMEHRKDGDGKGTLFLLQNKGKSFQKIIPDYIRLGENGEENIIGDAKYVLLQQSDRLNAEQAAAIYYKTIMYMYRFKAKKGFLFYPVTQGENVECFSDYSIKDTDGHLYKMGLRVAEAVTYREFCQQMLENERALLEQLKELVG